MTVIYPIQVNSFFDLVERLCWLSGVKNTTHYHSKKMYGNIRLAFLVCYKERLNKSYRRFVEICGENGVQRMLCIKRMPHFTTLQKFVQRTPKAIFEKLVRACRKLLGIREIEATIDGTGFSNTNPSHYYVRRCEEQKRPISVKNYTKALFLADTNSKMILNVKTFSDNTAETTQLKPMVSEIAGCLKMLLADKGYDSMSNRKHCRENGIEVHIPLREYEYSRNEEACPNRRNREKKLFSKAKYNRRAIAEAVNSAIKRTLGNYVNNRTAENQQKQATIKAVTYNIEHMQGKKTIKVDINIFTD